MKTDPEPARKLSFTGVLGAVSETRARPSASLRVEDRIEHPVVLHPRRRQQRKTYLARRVGFYLDHDLDHLPRIELELVLPREIEAHQFG